MHHYGPHAFFFFFAFLVNLRLCDGSRPHGNQGCDEEELFFWDGLAHRSAKEQDPECVASFTWVAGIDGRGRGDIDIVV